METKIENRSAERLKGHMNLCQVQESCCARGQYNRYNNEYDNGAFE